jgi:hypothetical protein
MCQEDEARRREAYVARVRRDVEANVAAEAEAGERAVEQQKTDYHAALATLQKQVRRTCAPTMYNVFKKLKARNCVKPGLGLGCSG